MKKGLFITFEGGDGAGKSTQIKLLHEYLQEKGIEVVLTREPGGTAVGESIRNIILDSANTEMTDMTECMLYAAARAQIVNELIIPSLEAGKTVICDRFIDSGLAYQSYGRGLGDAVMDINRHAIGDCMPDVTFLLKAPPKVGSKRISGRELDRIEQASEDFHDRVYNGYLELEKSYPDRIVGIDGTQSISEISSIIRSRIDELIR